MTRIIEIKKIESCEDNENEPESCTRQAYYFHPIRIDFDQEVIYRAQAAVNYFKNIMLYKDTSYTNQPNNDEQRSDVDTDPNIISHSSQDIYHTSKKLKRGN